MFSDKNFVSQAITFRWLLGNWNVFVFKNIEYDRNGLLYTVAVWKAANSRVFEWSVFRRVCIHCYTVYKILCFTYTRLFRKEVGAFLPCDPSVESQKYKQYHLQKIYEHFLIQDSIRINCGFNGNEIEWSCHILFNIIGPPYVQYWLHQLFVCEE